MASKAINEYDTFSGNASAVNILVQEKSQDNPNTYKHKKVQLDTIVETMSETVTNSDIDAIFSS